jgi:2-oxoglutarate ferredoxin oxidoreductase subunit alpha
VDTLPDLTVKFRTDPENYMPYMRDPKTLARPWVVPGTPGMEHRVGGLEKEHLTGNVSYDPENHEFMTHLRAEKIERITRDIPDAEVLGDTQGDLLVVGWGSTYGALRKAVTILQQRGHKVSHMHMRHLSPMAPNVEKVLRGFKTVAVAEMNLGQLRKVLREKFLLDIAGINKIQGQPFRVGELVERMLALMLERAEVKS